MREGFQKDFVAQAFAAMVALTMIAALAVTPNVSAQGRTSTPFASNRRSGPLWRTRISLLASMNRRPPTITTSRRSVGTCRSDPAFIPLSRPIHRSP